MQVHLGTTSLDARFEVEMLDGRQTVLFLSRGGNPRRNTQYGEGLDLVLERLAAAGARLELAALDSADTQRAGLPLDERVLDPGSGRNYPIALGGVDDLGGLRQALTRSAAATGRAPNASGGGNNTKQIRLFLSFEGEPLSNDELAATLASGLRILVVALPQSARKNLDWGLENGIWGFPVPRFEATETQRVRDYKALRRGDKVLLLSGYTGGSPRASLEKWLGTQNAQPNQFTDCYLCTVNQPYFFDTVPFWPDEMQDEESLYPHRIGIDPLAIGPISLKAGIDLSPGVIEAVRRSQLQGAQGFAADATGSPRLNIIPPAPGAPPEEDHAETTGPVGQGRSVDPIRRKRVEERAVKLARARYEDAGWTVKDVSTHNDETYGTPYDLRCSRGTSIRHVEVKGTSGSGETVRVSANERHHAAASNPGTESFMFVVEQIGLKTVKGVVRAVGGNVRYDGPFLTDGTRFVPTQYRYVVPSAPADQSSSDFKPS
jgi:hypothetical protein